MDPYVIALVLDEINATSKKGMKHLKVISLQNQEGNFLTGHKNLAKYYGLPMKFTEEELKIGTYDEPKKFNPGFSQEMLMQKLKKGIYAYEIYKLCGIARDIEREERRTYSLCYGNSYPTPYQRYLISNTYQYFSCDVSYINETEGILRKIKAAADYSINDITNNGILFFTDPEKLKKENPVYYHILLNLIIGPKAKLYKEMMKKDQPVHNPNRLILPQSSIKNVQKAAKTNINGIDFVALREEAIAYNSALVEHTLPVYIQYFRSYPREIERINNPYGYSNF